MNEQCLPNMGARRFEEIDFEKALCDGRRYLCLDLDNTLLPQRGEVVSEVVKERLQQVRESGRAEDVCLISNVIVPGKRVRRLYRLAKELNIDHVVPGFFCNRKPLASPFKSALKLLQAEAKECVMVGDQIFSDILGGNRMGFYTIWLEPMSPDHWTTLMTGRRMREKAIVAEIKRRGLMVSKSS